MNVIDTIFPFYIAVICILAFFKAGDVFKYGPVIGLISMVLGYAVGFGIIIALSAGILWIIIGTLSFFGVASVGAWTVGFSWTAVKMVMMLLSLITFLKK